MAPGDPGVGPDAECPSCSGVIASVTVTGPSTAIVSPCGCTVPPDLLPELGSGDGDAE